MTANQRLILANLQQPIEASALAHRLGMSIEAAYTELVALEAAGAARLRIDFSGGRVVYRAWVAT